jgi:tripartite-type tricarboxylate transporter receptor subunit TctC
MRLPDMQVQRLVSALTAAAVMLLAPAAAAETWPKKPIKLVVPFAAGGSADTLGRFVAQALSESLGQQVYVENRGGAGGVLGSAQVARADPDGYTLVVSGVASHVIAPAINPNTGYDPLRDFTHIAYLGGPPVVWAAHPSLGVRTFGELLKLIATSKPPLAYGSPGPGTQGHLVAADFARRAAIEIDHIPYRGAGPAVLDLVAGHIKLASVTWTTALGHIKAGTVLPLAVSSDKRLADFPAVPTFKELGYPDIVATAWFSVSGPPGMPKEIVERLNREIVKALQRPDIRKRLDDDAIEVEAMDAETFSKFVAAEVARWTPIAKASGAQPE